MRRRLALLSKKWLILILGLLLVPLFQNMSWIDIRDLAPRKPAGYFDDPNAAYVPTDFHGNSLEDVRQGFLSHNLDPWFRQFETRYLHPETPYFGLSLLQKEDVKNGEMASLGNHQTETSSNISKWRLAIVNPRKVRLTLQRKWSGQDFEMVCEADAGEEGVRLGMTQTLTSSINLSFLHQTGLRQSQLQMTYQF